MGVRGSQVESKFSQKSSYKIDSQVKFVSTLGQEGWSLAVNLASTTAYTSSEGSSFALGNHSWKIVDDAPKCKSQVIFLGKGKILRKAEKHLHCKVSTLKLSVCIEGEFSCASGDCIRMEERCDQVLS